MKSRAVVTTCFGESYTKLSEKTHPSIKAYANKIGADFIVINEKKLSKKFPHYEKFQIKDLFKDYKRIIYMDMDLIVRPDCPDLFEIVPEHQFGIFDEGKFIPSPMSILRDACMKYGISLSKWNGAYFNTGVMVFSRIHKDVFEYPKEEYDLVGGYPHYEQPYINLKLISGKYEIYDIGYKFNRMSLMDARTGENRLSSFIVHYAGGSIEEMKSLIDDDLKSWEDNAPEYSYPRNIHITVGGGLGDQIDSEPVIRYIINNVYPKDNIRLKTDFPRIFRHLPVKIWDAVEARKDRTVYYEMETLPSPETPLWNFLSHTLCHTVDFASISTLRRTLPDNEKNILLDVTFDEIVNLCENTDLRNLSNLVLVHPGKGWESKTFPPDYWQEIIDGLVKENIPVAIIGKYVSQEQGLVDIECPEGAIDLRNMLNLNELITLISQAKVLLSNDSAPIHIAGAFDNWIVLLPTCKNPDHILPYRHGFKRYKAAALYKKLTSDAIDSSPTQVYGQTIDYVIGDIRDYLPDTSEVVKQVSIFYNTEGAPQ